MLCCVTPDDGDLRVRGFHALWRGERPLVADIGGDPATVDSLVRQGRLEVDPDGRLVAVHGLAARPTPHRIDHAGGSIHTWCAFDAVGIPAALGIDARATTSCPTCGRTLDVELVGGQLQQHDDRLRLWLPTEECTHLVDEFCAHANIYCDEDHLAGQDLPAGTALTLPETAELGRDTWRDVVAAER